MSTISGSSFISSIEKHAKKVNVALEKVVIEAIQELNRLTIYRTPIDKETPSHMGTARGGWNPSLDRPLPGGSRDPLGHSTVGRANSMALKAFGRVYFLSNNVDYIGVLEYGLYPWKNSRRVIGGFSTQAPAGMLRISVKEVHGKIPSIVRKHKV